MTKSEQIQKVRAHYEKEMKELAKKYKVHSSEGMPEINLDIHCHKTCDAGVSINWGCCGSQSIEYTIKFQQYLKEVIELANSARYVLIQIKAYKPSED